MRLNFFSFLFFLSCTLCFAQKTEVIVQSGHFNEIISAAYSPNGKIAATGSKDKSLILYDVATGLQMATYRGFNGWVEQVQFSSDNNFVGGFSCGPTEGVFVLWNISKNDSVYVIHIDESHSSYRFRISDDNKIIIFRVSEGFMVCDFKTGKHLYDFTVDVDFSKNNDLSDNWELTHDGKKIICEDEHVGKLIVADLFQKKQIMSVDAPELKRNGKSAVEASVISKDDKFYYRCREPEKWYKYDIATGQIVNETTPFKEDYSSPSDFHFTADGKTLEVNFGENIYFFDVETGKKIKEISFDNLGYSHASAVSNDGKQVIFSCGADEINLGFADVQSGKIIRVFKGFKINPTYAKFSNDSKNIAISAWNLPYKVWNMQTADGVKSLPEDTRFLEENPQNMIFSPDDKVLMTGGEKPHLVFLPTLESKKYSEHFYHNYDIETSDGDENWVIADPSYEKIIKENTQYKMADGGFMCDYGDEIYQAHRYYTPDGKYSYCCTTRDQDDSVRVVVYDASNCKKIKDYKLRSYDAQYTTFHIALSSDGKKIVILANDITVAELLTGKVLNYFNEEKLESVGFSNNFGCVDVKFNVIGDEIAAAENYNTNIIRIFSLTQGKVVQNLKGHNGEMNSIYYSPDGKLLVSTAKDGKIILWNPKDGKQLATFVSLDSTNYVVTTPDNYYMSTKNGLKAVAFRVGNKMFPVEQFDLRQNRPDTVLQRLGTASSFLIKMYKLAWQKRLKKAGYTPEMLGTDFNIPEIEIKNKYDLPLTSKTGNVSFDVLIKDTLYNLNTYNIYVNDVPVYGMNGVSLKKNKTKSYSAKIEILLSSRINKIQVSAFNEKGSESMRETFEVFYETNSKEKHDLYIIAIGVSEYTDSKRNLTFAAKDAADFTNMMKINLEKYNSVNIKLIINKEATLKNVTATKDFFVNAKTDDQVILYFSGHGLLDDQLNYYLALTDVDFDNPSKGGLPYDVFEKMIDSIVCRNRLVLIDACHSGEVDKEETVVTATNNSSNVTSNARSGGVNVKPKVGLKNSFEYMQALFTDVQKGTGATIISAAGGLEFALESKDWNNGVFTYSIMNGLKSKEADYNGDGDIRVSELRRYVGYKVFELTNGSQRPTTRKENLGNDFIIY